MVGALVLPVGGDWYALDLRVVREVLLRPRVTRVPAAPASLIGLANLRGNIVPLFDTGRLLGVEPTKTGTHAVVVEVERSLAALAVTAAPERAELEDELPASAGASDPGRELYRIGGRIITLLDLSLLVEQLLDRTPSGVGDGGR